MNTKSRKKTYRNVDASIEESVVYHYGDGFYLNFNSHYRKAIGNLATFDIQLLSLFCEEQDKHDHFTYLDNQSAAKEMGCPASQISRSIGNLIKEDCIIKLANGVFQVNPANNWKGSAKDYCGEGGADYTNKKLWHVVEIYSNNKFIIKMHLRKLNMNRKRAMYRDRRRGGCGDYTT